MARFFTLCPLKFDLVCRTWLLPFLIIMAHVKRKRRLKHWRAKHERWTDVCISHRVCTFLKLVRVEMGYDNTVQSIQWNVYFFKMPSRYHLVCIVCVCLGLLRYLLTFCTVTHRLHSGHVCLYNCICFGDWIIVLDKPAFTTLAMFPKSCEFFTVSIPCV